MKIINTSDEVVKVYTEDDDDIVIEFEHRDYTFTPLEAHTLGKMLVELAKQTEYFKGLDT